MNAIVIFHDFFDVLRYNGVSMYKNLDTAAPKFATNQVQNDWRLYKNNKEKVMENKKVFGHGIAIFTIFIWGTTFISTKILLRAFQPVEILFFRFVMGFILLWIMSPHRLPFKNWKQELTFAGAGLTGMTMYYLMENIALTYSQASNVGVIVSIAPVFTAITARIFLKEEGKLRPAFFAGCAIALVGISLISFSGTTMHLNPIGDILSVGAAIVWSFYSVLSKKIGAFGYSVIQTTRRTFFYGILFMVPALFVFDFKWDLYRFATPAYLFNIFYLGLGASAICFVTWNMAVRILGAIKTSVYIYLAPVVTAVTSVIVLHEKITFLSGLGIVLVLGGLLLSEQKKKLFPVWGRKQEKNVVE